MSALQDQFGRFFFDVHGHRSFPWQERLVEQVCTEGWPKVIGLPTGSGKTACLDIAVFALAYGPDGVSPRRIFYVVDRRLVVNEAHLRMKEICGKLSAPATDSLRDVRDRLLKLGHEDAEEPLSAFELRGGIRRDESWIRTPLQPTLVASTVDQVGSCLLFRGYGVNDRLRPIYASLIANDSLILLDEAHASRAFAETLASVEGYCGNRPLEGSRVRPVQFVEMTATPSRRVAVSEVFSLSEADRDDETLSRRLRAPKPVRMVTVKAKKDDWMRFAAHLVDEATAQAKAADAGRVAILCNRVQTARFAYEILCQAKQDTVLLTGRMRPLDRDDLYADKLRALKTGEPRSSRDSPLYVVATQSLEVGADLDFDVLVSEIASLDAILQRFGRLNRDGAFASARGSLLATGWHLDAKKPDPVYLECMPRTWEWLARTAVEGVVQMALESETLATVPMLASKLSNDERKPMILLGKQAPILLPAHLDALVQTNPRPAPDPDVAVFLHGVSTAAADANVVWRGDLTPENQPKWPELIAFCPPLSSESLPARLGTLRRWLEGNTPTDAFDADIEGVATDQGGKEERRGRRIDGVLWRGGEAEALNAARIRPGDTVVLPVGKDYRPPVSLGHCPAGTARDLADRARWLMKGRVTLRIHPGVIAAAGWPECKFRERAEAAAANGDIEEAKSAMQAPEPMPGGWLCELLRDKTLRRQHWNAYPTANGTAGVLFEAFRPGQATGGDGPVSLESHLDDVRKCASQLAARTVGPGVATAIAEAAHRHDWGKADPRFQARLRGGNGITGRFARVLLAKSGTAYNPSNDRSGLPSGFRHEMLSFLIASRDLAPDHAERELVLHLIASHHGYCRPLASVVPDPDCEGVRWNGIAISADELRASPAHHLSHGVADRFWALTYRFGWWGLAYLEALLRLADWEASAAKNCEVSDDEATVEEVIVG